MLTSLDGELTVTAAVLSCCMQDMLELSQHLLMPLLCGLAAHFSADRLSSSQSALQHSWSGQPCDAGFGLKAQQAQHKGASCS